MSEQEEELHTISYEGVWHASIPWPLVQDKDISNDAKIVWVLLNQYTRDGEIEFDDMDRVKRESNLNDEQFKAALNALREKSYI